MWLPPLTSIVAPVMYAERSDARNRQAPAILCGEAVQLVHERVGVIREAVKAEQQRAATLREILKANAVGADRTGFHTVSPRFQFE